MLEAKVREYWTLSQRYHRAQTKLTKMTALEEMSVLYASTAQPRLKLTIANFLNKHQQEKAS